MCTGLILGAVGTGLSAVSSFRQAQASNAAAEYNAQTAEAQAQQAGQRGRRAESKLRREGRQLLGAQKVGYAASGVELGTGSAQRVLEDTTLGVEYDAMDIRYNTALEQYGFRSQAALQRQSRVSPFLAAAPTLLSGASSLATSLALR